MLRHESQLFLVPERQDADFISRDEKTIERYVTGLPVGNDQLPYLAVYAPAEQWMRCQMFGGRLDRRYSFEQGALDVLQRARRKNYRRHDLGRFVDSPRASLPIQA